jgi:hypothetical protein
MTKRISIAAGLVFLMVLGLFMWRRSGAADPVYQGRPISRWLRGHVASSAAQPPFGSQGWRDADEALRKVGTNAIPVLLEMIAATDIPRPAIKILDWARNRRLISYQYHYAYARNDEARYAFEVLGARAASAVPRLTKIYTEKLSRNSESSAASALGSIGSAAQSAVPVLLRDLTNSSKPERFDAVSAVMRIGGNPDLVVPALLSAAKDSDVDVRWNAIVGLGIYGSRARMAVPTLEAALADNTKMGGAPIKDQVEIALWRIAPEKVGKPLVVVVDTALTNNGLTFGTLDIQFKGQRKTLIPSGESIPCVRQFWDSRPEGFFTVYRTADGSSTGGISLGEFEVLGVASPPESANVSLLGVVADGKIFLCARDNNKEEFLVIRKVE